jgi:hypothetical protein
MEMFAQRLGVLALIACVGQVLGLRTGVAPTYIPTMRQISSYETSNIDTYNDAIMSMRRWESIQRQIFAARHDTTWHKDSEHTHNTMLRAYNHQKRYDLNMTYRQRMFYDDQSYDQIARNKKLEPMNILLYATKQNQQVYMAQSLYEQNALDKHERKQQAHNEVLLAEKKSLKLSIEENERQEWFNHENAIAVEQQRRDETKSRNWHFERNKGLNQFVSDMVTRNNKLRSTVAGLTTDRDQQEAAKLSELVRRNDMMLQTDGLEVQVRSLQKSVATLEKLRMQYQMANSDLTFYNTKLSGETDALIAERDILRTNFEEMVNQRNAAQLVADHNEAMYQNQRQNHLSAEHRHWLTTERRNTAYSAGQVCWARNTVLKGEKATLETTNNNLRDNCY